MSDIETVSLTVIPPSNSVAIPLYSFCMHTRTRSVSSLGNVLTSFKYTFNQYKY